MSDLDFLMSDQFVTFSKLIAALHQRKKDLKADFKKLYDQYQADIKAVDVDAATAQADFDAWKAECQKNVGDG